MLISKGEKIDNKWKLTGPIGEELFLPAATGGEKIEIGTLGTATRVKLPSKVSKYSLAVELFNSLHRPVCVLDVRRTGMGGSGSWGPEVFTALPQKLTGNDGFQFIHLPDAAPWRELLDRWRKATRENARSENIGNTEPPHGKLPVPADLDHDDTRWRLWQVFAASYRKDILELAVQAVRAFIEATNFRGGLPVLLCTEPHAHDFDEADQDTQDDLCCHRFTLAKLVTRSINADLSNAEVERVDLDLGEQYRE
tara:strand:+ start:677 stop:1435 length:759 start_codon:yes stop_codon:yes gene_type:complete